MMLGHSQCHANAHGRTQYHANSYTLTSLPSRRNLDAHVKEGVAP